QGNVLGQYLEEPETAFEKALPILLGAAMTGGALSAGAGLGGGVKTLASNPLTSAIPGQVAPIGAAGSPITGGLLDAAGGMTNGAFLGEGAASGIGAWDAAAGLGGGVKTLASNPLTSAIPGQVAPIGAAGSPITGGLLGGTGSAVSSLVSNPWIQGAGLLAGAVGGATGGGASTTTSQSKTDPRIDPYIYGDQGILPAAAQWFDANRTGVNPTMRAGWDMQLGLLQNPAVLGQLSGLLAQAGQGAAMPVSGNPFRRGG
ncbi:MAG TPA: hypothetical protein PKD87_16295, partial [Burkholderiaceae bacterium]|nr:hypothetical protein [Burkholderiaceae bacterium]